MNIIAKFVYCLWNGAINLYILWLEWDEHLFTYPY